MTAAAERGVGVLSLGRATTPVARGADPIPVARAADPIAAVSDLFRVHAPALTRLASLLVDDRGQAEDVVQDAFAGLFRRWEALHDEQRALAYLRTAVVNGSRSKLRRRKVERSWVPPFLPAAESAEEHATRRADQVDVGRALAGLPRRQRQVLVLRYHEDLSEADIAATLGISRGAVKGYASRGLAALAGVLGEQP